MYKLTYLTLVIIGFLSCGKIDTIPASTYDCSSSLSTLGDAHPRAAELNALMDDHLEIVVGLQVAISDRNGNHWTSARGFADIEAGVELETCHRIPIASISKVITATIILQLVDEGFLILDDPLRDHVPANLLEDLANADVATIRQLLNHTSGIPDYLTFRHFTKSINVPYLIETQREKLKYARGQGSVNEPGAEYSYSNTNFVLLGIVAEEITGKPLWDIVDERITQPLALENFAMGTESDPIPDDVARPYLALKAQKHFDMIAIAVSDAATGDGGILTNMLELNIFARALFSGQLLSANSYQLMTTNFVEVSERQADFEWPNEGYSTGVSRFNTPHGLALGHTGSTATYGSVLFYFVDSGITLSYITTSVDNSLGDDGSDRVDAFREKLLEIATR